MCHLKQSSTTCSSSSRCRRVSSKPQLHTELTASKVNPQNEARGFTRAWRMTADDAELVHSSKRLQLCYRAGCSEDVPWMILKCHKPR
jgi:hypothetical protein